MNQTIKNGLYEIGFLDKVVLFKLEEYTENFLKGEIVYPFEFKVDYYTEEGFTNSNMKSELIPIIICIGQFLFTVIDFLDDLTKTVKVGFYELSESEKRKLKNQLTDTCIENFLNPVIWPYFGKTLRNEIGDAIYNIFAGLPSKLTLKDRSFYKEFFYDNPGIQCIFGRNEKFDYSLFYELLKKHGKYDITFKTTKDMWYCIPDEFVEICTLEEFVQKDGRIPLFVSRYCPTVPEMTDELAAQLEGCTIGYLSTGVGIFLELLHISDIYIQNQILP